MATTAPICSVTAVMNLATLYRTAPTRSLPQEHHAGKTDVTQGIDIPTLEGTGHTPTIMVPHMADISAGQSPAAVPSMTAVAVSLGTHYTPHPATTAAHTPIATHTMTHPIGIVTPHPAFATSPTDSCHYSMARSHSHSSNPHHTAQEPQPRKTEPHPRPLTPHSKTVTITDSPIRFFLRFKQHL